MFSCIGGSVKFGCSSAYHSSLGFCPVDRELQLAFRSRNRWPENEGTTGIARLVSSDGEFDLARMLDGASRDCWLRYDRREHSDR